jgi:5-methylcytosine-specific restriction endonuclease McrA
MASPASKSDLNKGHSRKLKRRNHWHQVSGEAMRRANFKCESCAAAGPRTLLVVHHLNYERPDAELLEDVQVLCRRCHGRAHSWWETEGKFLPDDDPVFDLLPSTEGKAS